MDNPRSSCNLKPIKFYKIPDKDGQLLYFTLNALHLTIKPAHSLLSESKLILCNCLMSTIEQIANLC